MDQALKIVYTTQLDSCILKLIKGSVVDYDGEAIVNAADKVCVKGKGVDGAINRAGGKELLHARKSLPLLRDGVRCEVGSAVTTIGGNLNANWCIHAVGPSHKSIMRFGMSNNDYDALLYSAYRESMLRAQEQEIMSIGFSLISAGVCRGKRPLKIVLQLGIQAVMDHVYEGLEEVALFGFKQEECDCLKKLMVQVDQGKFSRTRVNTHADNLRTIQQKCIERDENYKPK